MATAEFTGSIADLYDAILGPFMFGPFARETAEELARGYCQGTPLRGEIVARDEGRLGEVTAGVARALEVRFGPGPIESPIQAHIATARAA